MPPEWDSMVTRAIAYFRKRSDLHFSLGKHRSLSSSWSSRAMGMQGDCEGLHPSPSSSPSAPSPEEYDQLGAELRLPS
eukprot:5311113-Amphidinium_carterae.1